jgi:outer membrane receptor protein involved in Fe transport
VGQVDFLFSTDPGVGIYVDEVYLPRVVGSILDVTDIERIEILRGPQGTLFGKNTIGGALNITSQRPSGEFDATAEATFGSRDRLDGKLSVDVPFTDNLNGRLTLSSRNQDGYVERVNQPGRATGDTNSDGVRGLLEWAPDNGWNVLLEADYTRRREEAIANELIDVQGGALGPVLDLWNFLVAPTYGPGSVYDSRFVSRSSSHRPRAQSQRPRHVGRLGEHLEGARAVSAQVDHGVPRGRRAVRHGPGPFAVPLPRDRQRQQSRRVQPGVPAQRQELRRPSRLGRGSLLHAREGQRRLQHRARWRSVRRARRPAGRDPAARAGCDVPAAAGRVRAVRGWAGQPV